MLLPTSVVLIVAIGLAAAGRGIVGIAPYVPHSCSDGDGGRCGGRRFTGA
jgi:hypothetical protein